MAEPIELKIGQVWRDRCGSGREIVALGPEFLMYRAVPTGELCHCGAQHFRSLPGNTLVRPKHELWVNVYPGTHHTFRTDAYGSSADAAKADANVRYTCLNPPRLIACLKIVFEEGEGL